MSPADLIGAVVGFLLTLMVISYLLGDNALFRIAVHIFIGVAAGYTTVIVLDQVIWQQTISPLISDPLPTLYLTLPPLLLGVWLLVKGSSKVERLGNPVVAFLVGVGAATAVGGALFGTLSPQFTGAIGLLDLQEAQQSGTPLLSWFPNAVIGLLATVLTLAYFQFGMGRRGEHPSRFQALLAPVRNIGQGILAVTLGVLFAGVYAAALAAFVGRVYFIWDTAWNWIAMLFPQ